MTELDKVDQRTETFLAKWRGGLVQVWTYSAGHGRLDIRITSESAKGNMHLMASGCSLISGPFNWSPCNITFLRKQTGLQSEYHVVDLDARFFLLCDGLSAAENVKPVY